MTRNLLVFDIDDTITQSESQHQDAFIKALQAVGVKVVDENWVGYAHVTDSYILKMNHANYFSEGFSPALIKQVEEKMMERLHNLPAAKEIKGAAHMLTEIGQNPNYAVSFATGSFLKPALNKLNQAKIPYDSHLVIGSNEFLQRQEIVSEAIKRAQLFYNCPKFDNIIAFGDGLWDLTTAKSLGLKFVGIGNKNQGLFENNGVAHCLNDWANFDLSEMEIKLSIHT